MNSITKLIVSITLLVFNCVIMYLGGAFFSVSFNIAEWTEGTRLLVVMMGLGLGGYIAAAPFML